jgi:hypothetical protein
VHQDAGVYDRSETGCGVGGVMSDSKNPHLYSSPSWYEWEIRKRFPGCKEVKASRGYKYKVDGVIIDCKEW